MAMDFPELVQWFEYAVEIEKSRTRSMSVATANALGRMFRKR
jgi:pyridoxine/pyridoxamine 5'-phosphate oxidase